MTKIDDYLAKLGADKRTALDELRAVDSSLHDGSGLRGRRGDRGCGGQRHQ